MALHTLGTNANTSLTCLAAWVQGGLVAADLASIGKSIIADMQLGAVTGYPLTAKTAVIGTGTTHTSTTLDTLVADSGSPPLSQIHVGDLVLGAGIPLGTFVQALPTATSVTLNKAATASASGVHVIFSRYTGERPRFDPSTGILQYPGGRGVIKLNPGDYLAVDASGWPVVVSNNAVGYAGSNWHFV